MHVLYVQAKPDNHLWYHAIASHDSTAFNNSTAFNHACGRDRPDRINDGCRVFYYNGIAVSYTA